MAVYTVTKQTRIRKLLRKKYKMNDNDLNTYMIMKHHLDHIPSRDELINLEFKMIR